MRIFPINLSFAVLLYAFMGNGLYAQEFTPNYDESKVPEYTLPDPLVSNNGQKIRSVEQWYNIRRPEIVQAFENEVYGQIPAGTPEKKVQLLSVDYNALFGAAIRKEVRLTYTGNGKTMNMDVLIYLPKDDGNGPSPIFLGLNFYGNHTIHRDPGITITNSWVSNNEAFGITNNKGTPASRGVRSNRWPIEKIIENGYGLATIYYGDIDPDFDDGFQNGIHPLFYREGQHAPEKYEWGSIAAWAWGLSQALDYFETDNQINAEQVIVIGHSRLGKTSLWAGAVDPRFAIVISNDSGCGGAALSRRKYGETVYRINTAFPHWFCDNFNHYNNNEGALPVDQHMLISLIAPRPVYVASAEEDEWADPKGEFLSLKHSSEVYKLLGEKDFSVNKMPAVGDPITGILGYHIRPGKHDLTLYDWEQYIQFADLHFGK